MGELCAQSNVLLIFLDSLCHLVLPRAGLSCCLSSHLWVKFWCRRKRAGLQKSQESDKVQTIYKTNFSLESVWGSAERNSLTANKYFNDKSFSPLLSFLLIFVSLCLWFLSAFHMSSEAGSYLWGLFSDFEEQIQYYVLSLSEEFQKRKASAPRRKECWIIFLLDPSSWSFVKLLI